MKAKVQTELLKDGLAKILTILDKKNPRPILKYAKITSNNNQIEIIATDLEISAKIIFEANTQINSSICVNARNIFDIVKDIPEKDVDLFLSEENNETFLKLKKNNLDYSFLIYKSDEYPQLNFSAHQGATFTIHSKQLTEIINKTSYAISNDETRMALNGIFLQEIDSKLRAVSTDGHRLAMFETDLQQGNIEALINGIIIPKKGVGELKKLVDSFPESEITIQIDDTFLYAKAGEQYVLSVRLIAKEYPKYQTVIPNKTSFNCLLDKDAFFNAIKRIKVMTNEQSNRLRILITKDEMVINVQNVACGTAFEKVPISYTGKDIEIGFNAIYLIDVLSIIDKSEVILEFNNSLSPVIIRSPLDPNNLNIVMPLRL